MLFINTHVHGISGTLEIRQSLTTKDKEEEKCDLVSGNMQCSGDEHSLSYFNKNINVRGRYGCTHENDAKSREHKCVLYYCIKS